MRVSDSITPHVIFQYLPSSFACRLRNCNFYLRWCRAIRDVATRSPSLFAVESFPRTSNHLVSPLIINQDGRCPQKEGFLIFVDRCDRSQQLDVLSRKFALPLPRLSCRSVCTEYSSRCGDFLVFVQDRAFGVSASIEERALFGCLSGAVTPNCSSQLLNPPQRDCQGMFSFFVLLSFLSVLMVFVDVLNFRSIGASWAA